MAILYIRDVDENTMALLKEQAQNMGTNPTNLARMILKRYAAMPEVLNIDEKYRHFTEDIMALYQINIDELKHLMEKNDQMLEKLEDIIGSVVSAEDEY